MVTFTVSESEEDEDENEDSDQHNEVSSSSRETSPDVTGAGLYKLMSRIELHSCQQCYVRLCDVSITDEEEETEEQAEQQSEASHDSSRKVFNVTCGALTGTLHKHRFATGSFISLATRKKS